MLTRRPGSLAPPLEHRTALDVQGFLASGAILSARPEIVHVGVGLRAADAPDPRRASLFAPDFFLRRRDPWLLCDEVLACTREELVDWLRDAPRAPWTLSDVVEPDRGSFLRVFERVQEGFRRGTWSKVVPYGLATFSVDVGPAQIAAALDRILALPETMMPYGFWHLDEGLVGATPERLVEKTGARLRSVAMAGTRVRGSAQRPLLEDPKQLAEHQQVVDDLVRELGRLGPVEVGPREAAQLVTLEHLQTELSVELDRPRPFEQLVRALHPTPALGASPRGAADSLLAELDEELPRGRFGAPFGWRTPEDRGSAVVAIRNVQWSGSRARIAAGCGLVAASVFEDEWSELLAKQRSIRQLLGLQR